MDNAWNDEHDPDKDHEQVFSEFGMQVKDNAKDMWLKILKANGAGNFIFEDLKLFVSESS